MAENPVNVTDSNPESLPQNPNPVTQDPTPAAVADQSSGGSESSGSANEAVSDQVDETEEVLPDHYGIANPHNTAASLVHVKRHARGGDDAFSKDDDLELRLLSALMVDSSSVKAKEVTSEKIRSGMLALASDNESLTVIGSSSLTGDVKIIKGELTVGSGTLLADPNSDKVSIRNLEVSDEIVLKGKIIIENEMTSKIEHNDFSKWIAQSQFSYNGGTWRLVKIGSDEIALKKEPKSEKVTVNLDILETVRSSVNKGFKLNSFKLLYSITSVPVSSLSCKLTKKKISDLQPLKVEKIDLESSLSTAVGKRHYKSVKVVSPSYVEADSIMTLEIAITTPELSNFYFYGLSLNFTRNDL
jgi:hypothetical protein